MRDMGSVTISSELRISLSLAMLNRVTAIGTNPVRRVLIYLEPSPVTLASRGVRLAQGD